MATDEMPTTERFVTGVPFPPDDTGEHFSTNRPAQLSDEEKQTVVDMQWAMFDDKIQELYAGKIIAVHRRRVIAIGDDWKTVIEESERLSGLPGNLVAIVSIPDAAAFFGCH